MKKTLAIVLSVLLICISIAPIGFAVNDPGIKTRVMDGEYASANAGADEITASKFTLAIKVPAVEKLVGVTLHVTFDPNVLAIEKAGLAGNLDAEGTLTPFFGSGLNVSGYQADTNNSYAFGWVHDSGVNKSSARDMYFITFNVIDTTKTETSLGIYVDEFKTEDGDDTNDVDASLLTENKIVKFNFGEDVSAVIPDTTVAVNDGSGSGSTPSDINGLLDIIRDLLSGNGASYGDFADAMANLLGNAEISDMIEQLIDGNFDIGFDFEDILGNFNLDFSMLEDLLNKIIEFFMNLFGGGGDTPADTTAAAPSTTAALTTAAASENLETTSQGSSSGSEQTGDTGVALAAAMFVAASAAFVLTRKKKETV